MLPLSSFPLSLPATIPFFSQGFGCKTASHFVEFLCRINICNCKALGGTSPCFKGREEVMGDPVRPSTLEALKQTVGLVPSTNRSKRLLE